MQTLILTLVSFILTARTSSLSARRACVVRLVRFARSGTGKAGLVRELGECAGLADRSGDWYLAALVKRVQEEVMHALKPQPGKDLRKVFRRKINQYKGV